MNYCGDKVTLSKDCNVTLSEDGKVTLLDGIELMIPVGCGASIGGIIKDGELYLKGSLGTEFKIGKWVEIKGTVITVTGKPKDFTELVGRGVDNIMEKFS